MVAVVTAASSLLMGSGASALSNLSSTYVRLDRMQTGSTSSLRVVFTTSSATLVEDNVRIDMNGADSTNWTGSTGAVNTTQTVTSAACAADTGATALPGSLTAAGSGSVITISSVSNLAASTAYCVDLTSASAVTLPTAGEYHPVVTTQTTTTVDDKATVAVRVVSSDQVTVTANVPPTFNFQLDSNTTAFTANLTPGTKQRTTPRTFTVNTNAKSGWVAWVKNTDANGLFSSTVAKNIAPTTPGTAVNESTAPNTEQYVWGVSALSQVGGSGTVSIATPFDATGSNDGTGVDTTYRQVASSSGTADTSVVTFVASATISGITPAASDYTDVIQVIGAGRF